MTEPLSARLQRLERQIAAFRKLHADELQLIIDELRDLTADLESKAPEDDAAETSADASPGIAADLPSTAADPAAVSPKRARWLAEHERRSHLTRRDLLRGREADPGTT